ncbi:MAG: lysophospholipid acyltransferase family protein [Opitutales bacterium]
MKKKISSLETKNSCIPSSRKTFLYWLACSFSSFYFRIFHRLRVHGLENVPKKGSFILAVNHASFFDPPIAVCRLPRPVHFFARSSLFRGFFGKLIANLNAIPVNQDGDSDVKAIKSVLGLLRKGDSLLLFPEGTRSFDGGLQEAQRGIGMIACRTGVPVLPARIFGSYESFGRHRKWPKIGQRMTIVYGPMILSMEIDPGGDYDKRYETAADRVMRVIAKIRLPGSREACDHAEDARKKIN